MDEEEPQKREYDVSFNVDGIGGLGWIFAAVLMVCLFYDSEIRCALGNQKECARMVPETKSKVTP